MADEVLVTYKTNLDEFSKEMNISIEQQEKLGKAAEETSKDFQKSVNSETAALKNRQKLVDKEIQTQNQLKEARKRASDPKVVDQFNKAITTTEKNINNLKNTTSSTGTAIEKTFSNTGSTIRSVGLSIAASVGAAFSIEAIIGFSKAAVDAFLEAESTAHRLRFAITEVGNETEAVFQRLLDQSARLQAGSIFSDDDIQKAQTALSVFGLTADQIERLIPGILDLAAASKVDLSRATDIVIRGIEGQQRGLKELGVQLTKVGTETENYNDILNQTAKFTGAAGDATKTLTGELKQAQNQYDDLQEFVGEGLAGAFTNAKISILEAVGALLDFDKSVRQVTKKQNQKAFTDLKVFIKGLEDQGKTSVEVFDELSQKLVLVQNQVTEATKRSADARKKAVQSGEDDDLKEATRLRNILLILQQRLEVLQQEIDRRKERAEQDKRELNTEELKKKTISELLEIKKQEEIISDSIARSNIDLINKELEARKKASEEARRELEKSAEAAKAAAEKEAAAFEKMFQDIQAAQERSLKDLEAAQKERDSLLKFEVQGTLNTEGVDAALNELRNALQERFKEEEAFIDKRAQIEGQSAEEVNARKLKSYEEFAKEFERIATELGLFQQEQDEQAVDSWISRNQEMLRVSADLVSQIAELQRRLTEGRVTELENQLIKVQETATLEQEALDTAKERRLVSEADYRKRSDEIAAKRIENEKRIQNEINKQKKKQAIIDKSLALFEIAINTARAIMEAAPNIILQALIAALGAAQAATVISTPIPQFAKGTKGKKDSGMAIVGEEGAEAMFIPKGAKILPAKQTKRYAEVFDAMYDNNLDKYIQQKFIAPALIEQKRIEQVRQEKSFANNIVNSIQYNGSELSTNDLLYANRYGVNIRNKEQFAELVGREVARQLPVTNLRRA